MIDGVIVISKMAYENQRRQKVAKAVIDAAGSGSAVAALGA